MSRTDILMTAPMMPIVIDALDRAFTLHRLWEQTDKEAFLKEVGPRIRGVATSTLFGRVDASLLDRLPNVEIVSSFGVGYDNVDAAESTAAFLRLEGHEVKAVHDGLQALASLKVFDPHVVVLDIGLPGLDGYAVARQLRERGDTSHVLLIALTGYGQKEDRARAAAAGFDYHFVKPADPREIQAAIERGRNIAGEPALEAYRIGRQE